MDVVINYDHQIESFKVYEPRTDTIIITKNLTEALVNLSNLLESLGLSFLEEEGIGEEINYHLDSYTLRSMIESNVALLKKLSQSGAPLSGFTLSERKFGPSNTKDNSFGGGFKKSGLGKGKSSGFNKSGLRK